MGTRLTKTQQPNDSTRIEPKKEEEGRVLMHAYQQGEFVSNKKLDSCLIREKRKRRQIIKIFSGWK